MTLLQNFRYAIHIEYMFSGLGGEIWSCIDERVTGWGLKSLAEYGEDVHRSLQML